METPPWMADAECRWVDPDLFFPERGGDTATPKAVCAVCPVRIQCLDYALDNQEMHGIWGGMSERQRRTLRIRRRRELRYDRTQVPLILAWLAEHPNSDIVTIAAGTGHGPDNTRRWMTALVESGECVAERQWTRATNRRRTVYRLTHAHEASA